MNSNPFKSQTAKSILLVEDDVDDQDFITEALLRIDSQLSIHTVSNGTKVLPFLETLADDSLPNLLILDYNLPEVDGAEVLQMLRQNSRYEAIAKVVWSTSNAPQFKASSLKLGAATYLVKPSTIAGIESMAQQMLSYCSATS